MVEQKLPKLTTRVRFPSPAPFFLAAVLVFACVIGVHASESAAPGRFAVDHPFALVDADGKPVSDGDFPGKFLLVYFGYTHCADQCPTALSAIVEALDEIGPAANAVQPIFITVDPERDHGAMLRDFTQAFDKRIVGLSGSPEQIAAAAKALRIDYSKVFDGSDSDYVIDHSTNLSIIDPDRRMAETVALAEPYQIAAKLIDVLAKAGVPLGDVNNLRAWR
jgi:cytochrome oxidase Cu insertion factor (SCO1/SenC/PrrC family)